MKVLEAKVPQKKVKEEAEEEPPKKKEAFAADLRSIDAIIPASVIRHGRRFSER